MKTLLLLRHAKSSWKNPHLVDHDRPLNKRGRRDAPRMGRLLAEENLLPDLVLSSTAIRARTTAEMVAEAAGYDGEIRLSSELYHASPESMLAALASLEEPLGRVLLVGHNPGVEHLLWVLTERDERCPTAALARISLDVDRWRDLNQSVSQARAARLERIWRPKELDD